jgi:hypothetical protein
MFKNLKMYINEHVHHISFFRFTTPLEFKTRQKMD